MGGLSTPGEGAAAVRLPVEALTDVVADIFRAHELSDADARIAAEALVRADLRGVWSHGVARVPMYCARLAAGVAKARPAIAVSRVAPAAALVEGDDGLGLIVARRAMDEAVALAGEAGVGLVGVRASGHFGMAALYAEQASEAGCFGWVHTNSSPALPPWGGRRALFGTSPFAFAAPTPEGAPPFLIDMAMTPLARGKLKFAAQRGEAIPEGLALDPEGRPTTDGQAAFEGTLLPFGGVKGAALAWMMDLAAGVFPGAASAGRVRNPFRDLAGPQNVGHLMIAARADLFRPLAEGEAGLAEVAATAKAQPRAEGLDEILSPGEPEARREAANRAQGVPLSPDVLAALQDLAAEKGVSWPPDSAQ